MGEEKERPRVFTNDDLARVSPYRDQTGVNSTPAPAETRPEAKPPSSSGRGQSRESYWRREAAWVRDKIQSLEHNARELRRRIDERRRRPQIFAAADPQLQAWSRRLKQVEERIQGLDSDLSDRARREGAMPGWLR
jgi:hypothetical protein